MFSFLSSAPSPTVFADIPTVKDPQDCVKIVDDGFKMLLEFDNASDWEPFPYEDVGTPTGLNDIKLYSRVVPNSPVSFSKSTGIIPVSPKVLFEKLWLFDFEWVKTFDTDMREFAKLIEVTPEVMLTRVRANAPFPVAPREFILVRNRREVDGVLYIFSSSANYEASPVDTTYVRGVIPVNGYIFRSVEGDPNATFMTRIAAIDPKGAIPLWVVEMMKAKAGDYMARFRKEAAN